MHGLFSHGVTQVQAEDPRQVWKALRSIQSSPAQASLWENNEALFQIKTLPKQSIPTLPADEFIHGTAKPIKTPDPKSVWKLFKEANQGDQETSLWSNSQAHFYVKALLKKQDKTHVQPSEVEYLPPSSEDTDRFPGAILIPQEDSPAHAAHWVFDANPSLENALPVLTHELSQTQYPETWLIESLSASPAVAIIPRFA